MYLPFLGSPNPLLLFSQYVEATVSNNRRRGIFKTRRLHFDYEDTKFVKCITYVLLLFFFFFLVIVSDDNIVTNNTHSDFGFVFVGYDIKRIWKPYKSRPIYTNSSNISKRLWTYFGK